jgi:hypothetical protein
MGTDRLAAFGELRPHAGMRARDGLRDRDRVKLGDEVLDKCAAPCPARSRGPMNAMKQFTDSDHADRSLFLAGHAFERGRGTAALEIDEQIGVDQDGHGGVGAFSAARMARISSVKASSTGGALAISSRKRSRFGDAAARLVGT